MSLLHDALKKAERSAGASAASGGVLVDADDAPHSNKRMFALLGVVSVLLLSFTYLKFFKKPSVPAPLAPKAATSAPVAGEPDGARLLEEGRSLVRQGRYEEARDAIEKSLFANLPAAKTAEAYSDLGYVLKKLGRNEEAFQRYNKAVTLDPQCAECRNNLGVLYLSNRDFNEAESQFQEAVKAKPDYAEPYLHLALLLEARGDFAGAKAQYQKYTKLAQGVSADFLLKVQERMSALEAM